MCYHQYSLHNSNIKYIFQDGGDTIFFLLNKSLVFLRANLGMRMNLIELSVPKYYTHSHYASLINTQPMTYM